MKVDSPDAELLRAASRGDEGAFRCLYERHRTCIFRFAYRMTGSVQAAEEITHDCFLNLLRRPLGYRPELGSLRTYLWAAGRNLSLRRLRKEGLEITTEEPQGSVSPVPRIEEPLRRLLEEERARIVADAILSLTPLQREAVVLFEYHEMSLAEIAEISGSEIGTIKSRLHRARSRLRKMLEPWLAPANERAPVEGTG